MILLENAKIHFARIRVLEAMIADIDGLCGCGITTVADTVVDVARAQSAIFGQIPIVQMDSNNLVVATVNGMQFQALCPRES